MPWNLLIFPLAGGYFILTRCFYFKFRQQRLDRQRLIFESILMGSAVAAVAYTARFVLGYYFPDFVDKTYNSFPYKQPYTITSISTLLISIVATKIINKLFLNKVESIKKAIQRVGNEFELLIEKAFSEETLLQFTLENNKFYIGWVKELPIPSISNYIRIIPAISGFRDSKMNLVFTTHYLSVYMKYVEGGTIKSIEELNTDLIIDISDIITVSNFNVEMYEKFNSLKEEKSSL